MKRLQLRRGRANEKGAVLITGVIFLIVLTMFVLAMVRSGTLEERMARNARDRQVALEAAEAMLRFAETTVFAAPFDPYNGASFTASCAGGLCRDPVNALAWKTVDWKSSTATASFPDAASRISNLTTQPRYVVEIIVAPIKPNSATVCEPGIARITAQGTGNGGASVFLQSTVRFRVYSNSCD